MRIPIVVALLLCLVGCDDLNLSLDSGEVGWALKKEIRDKKSRVVSIVRLTRFEWDELFLFPPYEPKNDICKRLALTPEECKNTITLESSDDSQMLMVFRNKGKVVHTEIHIRRNGDFIPVPDTPFTPSTAVFNVVVEGNSSQNWFRLIPQDISHMKP